MGFDSVCLRDAGWEITEQDPVKYWDEWCVSSSDGQHSCHMHMASTLIGCKQPVTFLAGRPVLGAPASLLPST
jgi:hypothetical protein